MKTGMRSCSFTTPMNIVALSCLLIQNWLRSLYFRVVSLDIDANHGTVMCSRLKSMTIVAMSFFTKKRWTLLCHHLLLHSPFHPSAFCPPFCLVFIANRRLDSAMMCLFGCFAELCILPRCRMWQVCASRGPRRGIWFLFGDVELVGAVWACRALPAAIRGPSEPKWAARPTRRG